MMFECIDKIYPSVSIDTVTGSICNFTDNIGGLPLKSCTSHISGYQEGSGTPSPSNVRNLVWFDSATLTENGNTHTFTFGQSIYQGSIDWKRGVVVGTHLLKDMGSLSWSINATFTTLCDFRSSSLQGIIKNGTDSVASDINTEIFETVSRNKQIADDVIDSIAVSNTGRLIVYGDINTYPDITTFRSAMNGIYVAYELETPIEIPLGGINLLTQQGVNNIFCDTGDTTIEYININ